MPCDTGNNKKTTMIYIDYNTERMAPASNDRAKNEQREMIDRMTDEFVYLVNLSEGTPLRWVNSTTDLVEVCHMACLTERLREESGQPVTFSSLLRLCCMQFGVTMPANPRSVLAQAAKRKGIRQLSFIYRYTWQKKRLGIKHPMSMCVMAVKYKEVRS